MACCFPKPEKSDFRPFHPDYRTQAITEKFYARHDFIPNDSTERVLYYEEEIDKKRDHNPRMDNCIPRYTNQLYGWIQPVHLMHWQRCGIGKPDKVIELLKKHFADDPKHMHLLPIQRYYCKSKAARLVDHWKIV